jgi:hypothetical protein
MNTRLSFGSLAQSPVDLLVVVLDAEKVLHERVDDPALSAHLARAEAGFRDKSQKREYFATLPRAVPPRRSSFTGARASRASTSGRT